MSDPACPHCGEPLAPHLPPGDALLVDPESGSPIDGSLGSGDSSVVTESRVEEGSSIKPMHLAAVVVALLAALVGAVVIGDDDPVPERADQALDDPDENPDENSDESSDENSGDESGPGVADQAVADNGIPPTEDHLVAERIGEAFDLSIDRERNHRISYIADTDVITLSAAGVTVPQVDVAATFEQVNGLPLINDGFRTWVVDDTDIDQAYVASTGFVVVESDVSGAIAFINPKGDSIEIGVTSYGGWRPGITIPAESSVLAVAGRGLLVMPPTGGTFHLDGRNRLEKISDDEAVAAGRESEVYRRCDEGLRCELYISGTGGDGTDGDELVLPVDATSLVSVSPSGDLVATPAGDGGALTVIDTATGSSRDYGALAVEALGWAPDSSFLAVATATEMLIVFPADGSTTTLPLPDPPTSSDLLVTAG